MQTDFIRQALRGAMLISVAGVVAPSCSAPGWHRSRGRRPVLRGERVELAGMMYLGAVMSVTAFPVLARIIQERGIAGTALGTLALMAGATDDVIAWCLLAVVLASFNSQGGAALLAIAGGTVYAGVVLIVLRPQLAKMGAAVEGRGGLGSGALSLILALLMAGAWFTDLIGVHAVFGAFVMGVAMPRGLVAKELSRQVEPLATAMLVPLFFAYSGLSTRFSLLWSTDLLLLALLVTLVASVGKGVACWERRVSPDVRIENPWRWRPDECERVMGLIILNIGLDRGPH
jgi:Kef-type K+ transport system membrane component KefB